MTNCKHQGKDGQKFHHLSTIRKLNNNEFQDYEENQFDKILTLQHIIIQNMDDYYIESIKHKETYVGDRNLMDIDYRKGNRQHQTLLCPRSMNSYISLNDVAKKFK